MKQSYLLIVHTTIAESSLLNVSHFLFQTANVKIFVVRQISSFREFVPH